MKRILFCLMFLFLVTPGFCDSESTIGGQTGAGHIIMDEAVKVRQRPILNFVGAGVSCADTSGKTVCTIGGGGTITTIGDCVGPSCLVSGGNITVDTVNGVTPTNWLLADGTIPMTGTLRLFSDSSPTTSVTGDTVTDSDAWASGRGALQTYDGTASTYLIGALASDAPENGQVAKWGTGGTITWENDLNTAGITCADTGVVYSDGADNPVCDAGDLHYDKLTGALYATSFVSAPSATPSVDFYDSDTPDGDKNGTMSLNCPGVTSGAENCEITIGRQVAGAMVNSIILSSLGGVTMDTVTITTAGSGVTPAANDNDTSLATTAYVQTELGAILIPAIHKIGFETVVAADDKIFGEVAFGTETYTSIYCKSETNGAAIDVTVGGNAINGSSISCTQGGTLDDSLAGDTSGAVGDEIKLEVATSDSTYLMVILNGTKLIQ